MKRTMMCLSIKQPWADLIMSGKKDIEIRTWEPKFMIPRTILIHAGKKIDLDAEKMLKTTIDKKRTGAILGYAVLKHIIAYCHFWAWERDIKRHLNVLGWWTPRKKGFVFEDIRRIDPIPFKGQLGFFKVDCDDAITFQVQQKVKGARVS